MHLDSFFTMGKSHKVCEDYALCSSSEAQNVFFGISDGCSSSKDTDFGSRILLKSLENSYYNNKLDVFKILDKASLAIRALQMPSTCLDATLNYGEVVEVEGVKGIAITCIGDGFIVAKVDQEHGGDIEVVEVEFDKNAPYYLSYVCGDDRKNEFMKLNQKKTVSVKCYHDDVMIESYISDTDSNTLVYCFSTMWYPLSVYSSVSVFSDGLKTFIPHDQTQPKMPLEKVIKELISFPVINGEFVKRRCLKFLKTHPEASFYDDFSMATWCRA